jgi:hypothetical protein
MDEAPQAEKPKRVLKKGQGRQVLTALLESKGNATTADVLERKTGLDHRSVMTAMTYLVKQGLAERLGNGIWRTTSDAYHVEAEPEPEPVRPAPITNLAVITQQMPDVQGAVPTSEDLAVVLELLFPQGLPVRAFPLIERWMDATRQLVRAVNQSGK